MQVPRAETLEGREVTLRSGQSPQRMAAAGVVMEQAPQRIALAARVVVNVQRVQAPVLRERTARAEGVVVLPQQA